ncbi:hypothetical protein [Williamsia muralis]|uniref:Uncharacterized protein n=1 Tax=Williamsia marianensis TaxID=85044 RepID=A0ABU4EMS6_WILMA|nr:hypothetical protein [Williamsia muralis]MDV7132547.1 hypothetical protein [Williamsia muralis]
MVVPRVELRPHDLASKAGAVLPMEHLDGDLPIARCAAIGHDGTAVSATVNGVTATATLTSDDTAVIANATRVGLGSNSPTFQAENLIVAVNGFSTGGSYNTLHLYNASVPAHASTTSRHVSLQ